MIHGENWGFKKCQCIIRYWLLFVLLISGNALAQLEETLHYQARYSGIFSAGAEIGLADAVMRTYYPGATRDYLETLIEATSERYPTVEALYPIRYRFRTWYQADGSAGIAGEYWEQNENKPPKHLLIEIDDIKKPFITHDLIKLRGLMDLPLLTGGYYVVQKKGAKRFDRLSLIQHLRLRSLKVGDVFSLPITNGKMMLRYQIKVEKLESIKIGENQHNSFKLRIDGFKKGKDGKEEKRHRPAYVWLAKDAKQTMLRIVLRLRYGRFTGELQEAPPPINKNEKTPSQSELNANSANQEDGIFAH